MGGQSIPNFEYGLAPGVARSFIKNIDLCLDIMDCPADFRQKVKEVLQEKAFPGGNYASFCSIMGEENDCFVRDLLRGYLSADDADKVLRKAHAKTDKDCYQAMEGLVHNLNTMHSRAGAQVPFSSINYGTDTSAEGRMVIKNILLAEEAGLGNGETPIFPIHIFKVREGYSFNPTDPNYDLFKLACRVSAKRLFPNFSFMDAPFNKAYLKGDDPNHEVAYMGCRTRVMANRNDPERETTFGRGNLSFTSINLPRIALRHRGDIEGFFEELGEKVDLVQKQLVERLRIQGAKSCRNFPFLMGQGVWLDSKDLSIDDKVAEVLKHGTLTTGFIGLAEALVALIGKHHGQDEEARELGLRIVRFMRKKCDEEGERTNLNFTLIATPAEGLCLAGDTEVQTLSGNIPIRDVKVGDLLVNLNEATNKLEVDRVVKSGMTFKSAKVLKVTFDTGQSITCTPNHPFAKRIPIRDTNTGRIFGETFEWCNAENLRVGDRIRSGYIEKSITGYLRYKNHPEGYLHKLIYEYFTGSKLDDGYIVHHKDGNKENNTFSNLEVMSAADHKRYHMKDTIQEYCYTSEGCLGVKNPFYGKQHSSEAKAKISQTKRGQQRFKGDKSVNISTFADEYYSGSSINDLARKYGYTYWTMRNRLLECGVELRANHIVTAIEWLEEEIPVYDLTMEKNHNFFVGGDRGILVHNSGRFVAIDKEKFGVIEGVTDRDYYTNSFHVPVYFPIRAYDKLKIEAPYHAMTNGGHISYVELDGDPSRNLQAFEELVRAMKELGIGYGSLNHPVDRDPVCGYTGIIGDTCPKCGRNVNEGEKVERIRRITGYLVGTLDRFNNGKAAEESQRVKHMHMTPWR